MIQPRPSMFWRFAFGVIAFLSLLTYRDLLSVSQQFGIVLANSRAWIALFVVFSLFTIFVLILLVTSLTRGDRLAGSFDSLVEKNAGRKVLGGVLVVIGLTGFGILTSTPYFIKVFGRFIETVIGAYQESAPGQRTILVSTHLIAEFEGLIDEFTIMDRGRNVLTLGADDDRERYQKIRARFAGAPPELKLEGALNIRKTGREVEVIANGSGERICEELRRLAPESLTSEALSLEEIFVATLK